MDEEDSGSRRGGMVQDHPRINELLNKIEKYHKHEYSIPPPDISTYHWSVYDWVRYIDQCGEWYD